MEFGLSLIAIIAITGGIIAYLGDKIGSKIGKKRIRLFGLRPHNTSILITVITGTLIAATTIGVAAILSNNVRTALFGMDKLEMRMKYLNNEINSKNVELEQGKKLLKLKSDELQTLQSQIDEVNALLDSAVVSRNIAEGKLATVEDAYKTASQKLAESEGELRELEQTKVDLTNSVHNLENTKTALESTIMQLREGDVMFRNGEVLAGAVIKAGLDQTQSEFTLANILNDTNKLIKAKLHKDEGETLILVNPNNLQEIAKTLAEAKTEMLVRVIAAANAVYGERTAVLLVAEPYKQIYANRALVYEKEIQGGDGAEDKVIAFLQEVNRIAKEKGIIPNPLTGEVGNLEGSELYATIDRVRNIKGKLMIKAYTKGEIYTEGPLTINITIIPLSGDRK